jgi:hypothetical protein
VIGTVMQKVLGAHGPHGELTELSVIGGQEVATAVAKVELEAERASKLLLSTATALHGAIATALGSTATAAALLDVADEAVSPEPLPPVSSTFVNPSGMRLKVNPGHTFSVESNVVALIVIDPVEDL